MKRPSIGAWVAFAVGVTYFIVPLIGTVEFSLRIRRGTYSLDAYGNVLSDPLFWSTFGFLDGVRHRDDLRGNAARRPDRLLDPPETAVAAPLCRIHHVDAARHSGHRTGLRLSPALQLLVVPPDDRPGLEHQCFAGFRLRGAGAALPLPGCRHGATDHRCPQPDGGGGKPRRDPCHDPVACDLSQCANRRPQRRLPDLRDRDRRVHLRRACSTVRPSGRISSSSAPTRLTSPRRWLSSPSRSPGPAWV